jgi:hypothetical protein
MRYPRRRPVLLAASLGSRNRATWAGRASSVSTAAAFIGAAHRGNTPHPPAGRTQVLRQDSAGRVNGGAEHG